MRKSITGPIVMGVVSIVVTVAVLVGWSLIFPFYYTLAEETNALELGFGYWLILSVGCLALVTVIVVLILFVVSSVRQILYRRRVDTFVDSVTHELKSPLAGIRLGLETMQRHDDPEMRRELLEMMMLDVDRLQAFIELVLEAGRLEHGERGIELRPTNLHEAIETCRDIMQHRFDLDDDAIRIDSYIPGQARVMLDKVALETVVINLLENAVKYSVRHVDITIILKRSGDELVVAVSDRGAGIARSQLKNVFRRFYRVEQLTTRNVKGTGLGLYVVATLVEAMGGTTDVISPGEGFGATFTVTLPWREEVREAEADPITSLPLNAQPDPTT